MKNKKLLVLVAAIALLLCVAVGGTLAWLTAETTVVTNKFVKTKIEIELREHELVKNEKGEYVVNTTETDKNDKYVLLPGQEQAKDPFVRVTEGSEKCYVFIEVLKNESFDTYIESELAAGWSIVTGTDVTPKHAGAKIYAYIGENASDLAIVDAIEEKVELQILKDNQIKVSTNLTQTAMNANDFVEPEISFYAYAVQAANQPATDAVSLWKLIYNPTSGN